MSRTLLSLVQLLIETWPLFYTGLETNLVDNDDFFKYKSDGWTGEKKPYILDSKLKSCLVSGINVRRRISEWFDRDDGNGRAGERQVQQRLHIHSSEDGEKTSYLLLLLNLQE